MHPIVSTPILIALAENPRLLAILSGGYPAEAGFEAHARVRTTYAFGLDVDLRHIVKTKLEQLYVVAN